MPEAEQEGMSSEELSNSIAAAVQTALEAALKPVTDQLPGFTQRLNDLEAAMKADDTSDAAMPALKALRKDHTELTQKLARRMGLEFAARAGASPVERTAQRRPARRRYRDPQGLRNSSSEQNANAARALLGKK